MSLTVALTTLGVVLAVELPDKTLIATVVLATRYRAAPVLVGVSAAFAVQCLLAVTAGRVLTLLPDRLVAAIVAVLFAVGAALLLLQRSGEDGEVGARGDARGWWRSALTAFGVIFAAEWGDASQLATAGLTARYGDAVAVFLGSFVALVSVATLAVTLGQWVTRKVPLRLIRRGAGVIFVVFAVLAGIEAVRG
jgi:putative Ca2+/H+ antiporter (TMEM165/GDT1 family)